MCQSYLNGGRRHSQFTELKQREQIDRNPICVYFVRLVIGSLNDKLHPDWLSIICYYLKPKENGQ